MHRKTSQWFLLALGCIRVVSLVLAAPTDQRSADELQKWLSDRAVAVRSIDAADEDFKDLEPLVDAIGTARVVGLGEPSHGAGSSFAAKVRLIRFLHERMGFDVLAWESGLYDVALTQAAMRSNEEDAVTAAQKGILLVWSATDEVRPLLEYAKASQNTLRPLDMVGFDMQLNGVDASDRLEADIRSFVGALRDPTLREHAGDLVERAIAAHQHLFARSELMRRIELDSVRAGASDKPLSQSPQERMAAWEKSAAAKLTARKEDIRALTGALDGLLVLMRIHREAFLQVHATRQVTFMERAIDNLRGSDTNTYDNERADRPTAGPAASALISEGWNRRDALNTRTLRWLVEEGYPGKKIIIWAHNVHLMNAYYSADLNSIHIEPQAGGLVPSGVALRKWLGNDLYTIAMTNYEGKDGWGSSNPIARAPKGSLEWRLHELGKPYAFVDLRKIESIPGHPMHKPQSMRVDKYRDDALTDVTKAFDAVFYLDSMAPATPSRANKP